MNTLIGQGKTWSYVYAIIGAMQVRARLLPQRAIEPIQKKDLPVIAASVTLAPTIRSLLSVSSLGGAIVAWDSL